MKISQTCVTDAPNNERKKTSKIIIFSGKKRLVITNKFVTVECRYGRV